MMRGCSGSVAHNWMRRGNLNCVRWRRRVPPALRSVLHSPNSPACSSSFQASLHGSCCVLLERAGREGFQRGGGIVVCATPIPRTSVAPRRSEHFRTIDAPLSIPSSSSGNRRRGAISEWSTAESRGGTLRRAGAVVKAENGPSRIPGGAAFVVAQRP